MIHIKETEIIPFLKTAQTGYTKMISEGDLEMEVELAESKSFQFLWQMGRDNK